MNILENLCIATLPSKFEPDKPYVLYIAGHGPVGDKFNVTTGHFGKTFPPDASSRFATRAEAVNAYYDFFEYVKDVIRKKKSKDTKASYTHWE